VTHNMEVEAQHHAYEKIVPHEKWCMWYSMLLFMVINKVPLQCIRVFGVDIPSTQFELLLNF
jgi:hypothetical protein